MSTSKLHSEVQSPVQNPLSGINGSPREGVLPPDPAKEEGAKRTFARIAELRGRPLFYPFVGTGRGQGVYVENIDGSWKMDLINGIGINILGHAHPVVIESQKRAAEAAVTMQGNLEPHRDYVEITEDLVRVASKGSAIKHAWLATCGSMANENALKICRQKRSGARKIVAFESAFAGRSTMMAEITDNPSFKQGLPEYHEVLRLPFSPIYGLANCKRDCRSACSIKEAGDRALAQLREIIATHGSDIGCFVFEPMQGEGGYKVACASFLIPLLKECRSHGIPVWADEVQTFMRTGEFFAFQTLGIGEFVDVVTVAKTLQTGATLFTAEMNPKPGLIAGTFSGATSSLAVGSAIIKHIEHNNYLGQGGRVVEIHNKFLSMWQKLSDSTCKGMITDPGGLGLMMAFTPLDGKAETVSRLLQTLFVNGMIAFYCGKSPQRLRFLIPACITDADIDLAGSIFEKSLNDVSRTL